DREDKELLPSRDESELVLVRLVVVGLSREVRLDRVEPLVKELRLVVPTPMRALKSLEVPVPVVLRVRSVVDLVELVVAPVLWPVRLVLVVLVLVVLVVVLGSERRLVRCTTCPVVP
ncbi:MAG: hypothetical protein HY335_11325, partial [Deinococcus sp.]|nr:hypothetical protein [Deinococcus sp.]